MIVRIILYVSIILSLYLGVIPGMAMSIAAYFTTRHFYESFLVAVYIDIWYWYTFPYTITILIAAILIRRVVLPYIRI